MSPMVVNPSRFGTGIAAGAAFGSAKGTFRALAAHSVGQTYVLTMGFNPKLLILHSGPRDTGGTSGSGSQDLIASIGFSTGPTERCCVSIQDDAGAATMATDSGDRNDHVWGELNTSGSYSGRIDVDSWTWNGTTGTITLILDNTLAFFDRTIHWLAVGGSDVTAAITSHTEPGSAGVYSLTAGLSDPDLLLFISSGQTAASPSTNVHAKMCVGACARADLSQAVIAVGSEDAVADADVATYARSGQCIALMPGDPNSLTWRDAVTGISGTTVSMAGTERASTRRVWMAAVKGISAKVATAVMDTAGNPASMATSFRPTCGLFLSGFVAENADDTPSIHLRFSMGAYANNTIGTSGEGCWGIVALDGAANSTCASVVFTQDNVLAMCTSAGSLTTEIDINAINDTGVDLRSDDAPDNNSFVIGVLMGAGAP